MGLKCVIDAGMDCPFNAVEVMTALAEIRGHIASLNQQSAQQMREIVSSSLKLDGVEARLRTVETQGALRAEMLDGLEEQVEKNSVILRGTEQAATIFNAMRDDIENGLEQTKSLKTQIKVLIGSFTLALMIFQAISSYVASNDRSTRMDALEQRMEQRLVTLETTIKQFHTR